MNSRPRPSNWPFALLGAMTLVSFGGPFLILVVVQGGASAHWPPDRALEWITIALVLGLFAALFVACVTIGWWYPPLRHGKTPPDRSSPPSRSSSNPSNP
jgi:hypothetical protein